MSNRTRSDQIIAFSVAVAALFAAFAAVMSAQRNVSLQAEIEVVEQNLLAATEAFSTLREELEATTKRLALTRDALDALESGALDKTLGSYVVWSKDRDIRKLQEALVEKERELAILRKRLEGSSTGNATLDGTPGE